MGSRRDRASLTVEPLQADRRAGAAPAAWRFGWCSALALAALSAVAATTALMSQQLTLSKVATAVPNEGFYWSVAQYQIAHFRLKQELRAVAAGEPVNAQELSRRAAVLASKASILTEPSEVRSLLDGVPGYASATQRVAQLQGRVGPILEKDAFSRADAATVLALFQAASDEELVGQLASDVRLAEATAKEALRQSLSLRIRWAWGGFALSWAALTLWLLYAVQSRRRYWAAANDRQRAIQALEQGLVTQRRFLSMVNHEVRSPLQNIVASAELLAMKDHRPESVSAIRRIRHAVTVLQGQLRDLLTIARGDSAQLPMQAETFELCELVQDVCAGLQDAALAKGLSFEVAYPPAPVTVSADPIRIAQVLRNLVENAVRYTDTGQVRVRVDPFVGQVDTKSTNGMLRFVVQDSGPGLPAAAAQRLTSSAVSFSSSINGNGIGLFVVRDVLQQLKGQVEVRSRDASDPHGAGTCFTVCVPAMQVQLQPQPQGAEGERGHALSVLVVDDLSDVRDSLSQVTCRLGHRCLAAGSAAEARPLLARTRFDVALIDLEMPNTDGLALATEIRNGGDPNNAAMLVLISAAENRATGQSWPFDGFLQKPIDGQALARLIGSQTPH